MCKRVLLIQKQFSKKFWEESGNPNIAQQNFPISQLLTKAP